MTEYFGDIIIYKSHGLEGRILKHFTGEFTHSALRINRGSAQSLDLWGKMKHDLYTPKKIYDEYLILRHKNITPHKQNRLRRLNRIFSNDYDLKLIFQLGLRKLIGKVQDRTNLYHKGKYNCTNRIAHMYNLIGLRIDKDIHFSQIEPHNFLDSNYFEVIKEWKKQ